MADAEPATQESDIEFRVHPDSTNPRDIFFGIPPGVLPSEDQQKLIAEVSATVLVLQMLFEEGHQRFQIYYDKILSLAQLGFVGQNPQPRFAQSILEGLKAEIVTAEAGTVKNRYMRRLGRTALFFGLPTLITGTLLNVFSSSIFGGDFQYSYAINSIANLLFLWSGCMAGVWLSFGARKTILKFNDLNILEDDRLEPPIRLIFAGLLTLTLGLLFTVNTVTIEVGRFSTSQINSDVRIAIAIGILCGFSEKALSTKVGKHASKLLELD